MINLLLIISIILILVSYTRIILIYLSTKNINIDDMNGFELAKEITLKYDEINIVESKEINISKYNFKRRVIRLTTKDYNSNNIFNLSKITLLSGYSLMNINNDKYLSLLGRVLPNIDYINKRVEIEISSSTSKSQWISDDYFSPHVNFYEIDECPDFGEDPSHFILYNLVTRPTTLFYGAKVEKDYSLLRLRE